MNIDRKWAIPAAVGVVSFGVGAAAGYVVCAVRVRKTVEELEHLAAKLELFAAQAESDLQERILWEERQREEGDAQTPVDPGQESLSLEESPGDLVEEVMGRDPEMLNAFEGEPPVINHSLVSVFPDPVADEDGWDYAVEMENRKQNPRLPYIIHRDEYDDNEPDNTQTTLTYYEGDDILADDHDIPIYNPAATVGKIEFGKGSQDPNVCYVRNEKLNADYEILRDHGYFSVEVLGQEIEDGFEKGKPKVPKFRDE